MDVIIKTTAQGFLVNAHDWTSAWAIEQGRLQQIELTAAHWELLYFMRHYYLTYQHLPNTRMFIKAVATQLGADKGNSIYVQRLFPQTPLKLICQLAGLPKPPNCL